MIRQIVGSDGLPFWVPEGDNVVISAIEAGGWWEPALLPLFPLCCRPDRLTVEVGAYVGDHTIALLQWGPVLAFEPQPLPWACLNVNLATRSFAYSWTSWKTALYDSLVTMGMAPNWLPHHPSNGYHGEETAAVCAGPFDDCVGIQTVGFFKIDAQGCDLHVLKGAEKTIARDRPFILCEYEHSMAILHGDSEASYAQWFADHDYAIRHFGCGNILAIPNEIDAGPFWAALTDQGVEVRA